jgi:hypothetical protein
MTRYYNNISRHTPGRNSESHAITRIFSIVLLSLFAIFTTSCENGLLKLGTDFLPASDFVSIKSIDTLSVFTYTQYDPVTQSDNPSVSYLGHIFDPVFGTTTTDFVTQLRLASQWNLGGHVTINSVTLNLRLRSAKGGLTTPHTMKISEISDMLYPDSIYYSNRIPNLTDFSIDSITIPPVIKADTAIAISLPNRFGERIFRDPSQLFYAPHFHFNPAYPDFRSYFKGIYVQMAPSDDPLLFSLFLSSPVTGAAVHGTSENYIEIAVTDSLGTQYYFDLNLDGRVHNASYNRYEHNYLSATPELRVKHINDNYRDTLSYLQYLNGVYPRIYLPGLEKLKTDGTLGKIAVNKARLVVPFHLVDPSQKYAHAAPSQLVLRYKNNIGTKSTVVDYILGSGYADQTHKFFDGKLDSVNKVYKFNIPQFVQTYLEGTSDMLKPELEIYQGSEIKNIIFGANGNKKSIKFEFTYTEF